MKNLFFSILLLLVAQLSFAQENGANQKSVFKTIGSNIYGSIEINAQRYQDDAQLGIKEDSNRVSANSYLNLNYAVTNRITAGLQLESYAPRALKNYYEGYSKTGISNYFVNYKAPKWDVTLGHFYEQFGSGLTLRAFEERVLGLNNALRGGKVTYMPTSFINMTALYGRNRYGFKTAKSDVIGINTDLNLADGLKIKGLSGLNLGLSYVGRHQPIDPSERIKNKENFPTLVNAISMRGDVDFGAFYTQVEYVLKGKDVSYRRRIAGRQKIHEGKYFGGSALLLTTGYAKKGLAVSGTFRRLENMEFFARRNYVNSAENQYRMLSINFVPSLAKQHDYSLANIYIYPAQPQLTISNFDGRAGEIGGKLDFFYTFKKKSALGGKYGTKINANFSHWSQLRATFYEQKSSYTSSFLGFGKRLQRSLSLEINKKWSRRVKSRLSYINSSIDKGIVEGSPLGAKNIDFSILAGTTTLKLKKQKSLKIGLQHMWSNDTQKHWLGNSLEVNLNRSFSVYLNSMYNYANPKKTVNYYYFGATYNHGTTRLAINYGRQRGGLICTGGVCRYVSPNTGLTLNVNSSF